jgi:hypothetical protein
MYDNYNPIDEKRGNIPGNADQCGGHHEHDHIRCRPNSAQRPSIQIAHGLPSWERSAIHFLTGIIKECSGVQEGGEHEEESGGCEWCRDWRIQKKAGLSIWLWVVLDWGAIL